MANKSLKNVAKFEYLGINIKLDLQQTGYKGKKKEGKAIPVTCSEGP
jgi:hypothetical protein